jgi:hypothetical protein
MMSASSGGMSVSGLVEGVDAADAADAVGALDARGSAVTRTSAGRGDGSGGIRVLSTYAVGTDVTIVYGFGPCRGENLRASKERRGF